MKWVICLVLIVLGSLIAAFCLYLLASYKTNGKIEVSGRKRRYLLYVPDSYDSSTPTPLVVCFHGYVQWAAHQRNLSGWDALADKHGFIVVYPQGTGLPYRWHAFPEDADSAEMAEDVQFITKLLDKLTEEYNIDPARIYVNGMSNGGGMSEMLACVLSDRIAAIGGVAGAYLYPQENCQPSRPVPVIAFHGVKDPVVPYYGGPTTLRNLDHMFVPVEDRAAGWAQRNGCTEKADIPTGTDKVRGVRYTNPAGDVEVILYSIEDGGHTWPGGAELPKPITGLTSQEINATEVMWEFFGSYRL